jgi:hypothetical protein
LAPVSTKRAATGLPRTRPRDTGPDRATRALVADRDDWTCFSCGTPTLDRPSNLQHRDNRGAGGSRDPLKNSPANLITACGSPLTGCHGRFERYLPDDNRLGYWLRSSQDPAKTPVWHWEWGWVLLGHDGAVTQVGVGAA